MTTLTNIYPDCPLHFLAKRAFRFGAVTRADLMAAYGLSPASASRVFKFGQAHYLTVLRRQGHALTPIPNVAPPQEAGEMDLIEHLDSHKTAFAETGLKDSELHVSYPRWLQPFPSKPGFLLRLTRAIASETPVELKYCGLRRGETARWRQVLPLGLEQMGEQWRLLARDLEQPEYPLRVFVLARVMDMSPTIPKLPRACPKYPPVDLVERYRVTLNPALTPDQREAISHELGLARDAMRLPSRSLFEFSRRFVDTGTSASGIWPLASNVEKL